MLRRHWDRDSGSKVDDTATLYHRRCRRSSHVRTWRRVPIFPVWMLFVVTCLLLWDTHHPIRKSCYDALVAVSHVATAFSSQPPPRQSQPQQRHIQIRSVLAPEDLVRIRRILLQEYMNPLSIREEHLLVAYEFIVDDNKHHDPDNNHNNNNRKLLKATTSKLSSTSSSSPTLVGFGQLRPLDTTANDSDDGTSRNMELASIYVLPQYRRIGIASQIIQALLTRMESSASSPPTLSDQNEQEIITTTINRKSVNIYLLTLRPTVRLYERHGFRVVEDLNPFRSMMMMMIDRWKPGESKPLRETMSDGVTNNDVPPLPFQIEWIIGSILSNVLGNELVCMMKTTYNTAK